MKLAALALLAVSVLPGSPAPTFNKDIAPILHRNCASCHRPGEVAPFALLTYQDASKRAGLIAEVTRTRAMPPWKAEPGYGHFQDERRVSDAQIALLRQWAKAGAPEGRPEDKPVAPRFPEGWQAGKPDMEVTVAKPFHAPAEGRDVFQCFVIPLNLDSDKYVRTVEFRAGNRRVVHHALFFLDTSGSARELDAATPEPGYPCFGGPGIPPSAGLGGWAPGASAIPLPDGVATTIKKGSDLVMQIHYHPSGKPEMDQSSVGLTFTEKPTKGLSGLLTGTRRIDIPAGEAHYEVRDSLVIPQDVDLIGITPHAHYLCKEMKVDARLPDGSVTPLIWIKDWDFNWQGQYRYADPVRLLKGTKVEMKYIYDNSASNPHNPSSPPRRVTFGEQTTNEMALAFLQVMLPSPEDERPFRQAFATSRMVQMVEEGGEPAGLGRRKLLEQAARMFDKNKNGKLDPDEKEALVEFLNRNMSR
ncbi:MAG TPA: hypothetical protein VL285_02525 [Bryobacteraceae bacterium]|nr:hypothetical protein [Bryobacteraceae bacterium]